MRVCLFRHSPILQRQAPLSLPLDYTLNLARLPIPPLRLGAVAGRCGIVAEGTTAYLAEFARLQALRSTVPQGVRSKPSTPGASAALCRYWSTGATAASSSIACSACW
jgi:hypothetical protein